MNIVVLGAGAVGGYFGGKLANHGYDVTFLVRPQRFKQLQNHGLQVKSVHGDFSIQPKLATSADEINNPTVVIVALKNYHLNDAISQMDVLVDKGAIILPLLNGVEHLDYLTDKYGKNHVWGGLCQIETTLDNEGNIVQTSGMHDIIFGPLTDDQPKVLFQLEEMLDKSGVNVTLSTSIIAEMWRKFIFITTLSGITTTLRQPIGIALQDEVTRSFVQEMVQEICEVAKARNVQLPNDSSEQIIAKLKNLPLSMTSSMHRDLQKGLPLELDSIQGAVLKMATQHGVPTPNIKAIYSLLHPLKAGRVNN